MKLPRKNEVEDRLVLDDIYACSANAQLVLEVARDKMLEPQPRKAPPVYTAAQLAQLCGLDKAKFSYLLAKADGTLPQGASTGAGRTRAFTLVEARQCVVALNESICARPKGSKGVVIACSNLKGGSTKTTSAVHLAQALSLKGRKVLLVDLDSQSSLTTLMDLMPESDVKDKDTILPFFDGEYPDLRYAVQKTYWDGVDIIPATFSIFNIEVTLPIAASEDKNFSFWSLLEEGLAPLREEYDVIIMDCPPSLSYLTFNAIYAADGVVMPIPPESLDFASSAMFWRLFSELFKIADIRMKRSGEKMNKGFDFVKILLSKVNSQNTSTGIVRNWIMSAYGKMVMPVEIPLSSVTTSKSAEFGSIFDVSKYAGDRRTYTRIREAYDKFADLIDTEIVAAWARQVGEES
jgi:chromosome partitioning protein